MILKKTICNAKHFKESKFGPEHFKLLIISIQIMYITWILTQSSIHKNSEKNLILLNKILFFKK